MPHFLTTSLTTLALSTTLAVAQDEDSELIAFDFPGGSMVEYVQAIQQVHSTPDISLVVMPGGLDELEVPAMNIRMTDKWELVYLIDMFETSKPGRLIRAETLVPGSRSVVMVKPIIEYTPVDNGFGSAGAPDTSSHVYVYSLPRHADMASTLEAIEAGIEMTQDSEAVIRFHEPTGIIFVDASNESQVVVDTVLDNIKVRAARTGVGGGGGGGAMGRPSGATADQAAQIEALEQKLRQAEDTIARLNDLLKQATETGE
jgi:hypothetical protein